MASIPSSGTAAERLVRSFLHRRGMRFGRAGSLPGRPDVVLPRHRAVVFVQGCLWHGHVGCSRARIPKSNTAMWEAKVRRNTERDARVTTELVAMGWRVLEVWTCDLRASARRAAVLGDLAAAVTGEVSQVGRSLAPK
jgi:DNA mismatch endonuclease (patch repair protein)